MLAFPQATFSVMAKHAFFVRKISSVAPPRETCFRTHHWDRDKNERRERKSPAPGGIQTHDLSLYVTVRRLTTVLHSRLNILLNLSVWFGAGGFKVVRPVALRLHWSPGSALINKNTWKSSDDSLEAKKWTFECQCFKVLLQNIWRSIIFCRNKQIPVILKWGIDWS